MKTTILLSSLILSAGTLLAADSAKDQVAAAAKKLADQPNYSWKQTTAAPEGSRFRRGPTEGKTQKDGLTHVTMSLGDATTQAVRQGDKAAFTDQDGQWQAASQAEGGQGRGRFMSRFIQGLSSPAAQAAQLLEGTKELAKEGDAYTGQLTPQSVETLLALGGRGGGQGPTVSNAKGTVKFWIKDGVLSKYEYHVQGSVDRNGNVRETDRTTTVEIKDIGSTKIEVPAAAKQKLI